MALSFDGDGCGKKAPPGLIWVPWNTFIIFIMVADLHYFEEVPTHRVMVNDFGTNRKVCKFVNATGYVALAECKPKAEDYPGALPQMLKAGSLVLTAPGLAVDLREWIQWWRFKFGAGWRRPYGPRFSISGLNSHPVVHIAYEVAEGYAKLAGRTCPPRPNGNSPRAAASMIPDMRGVTSSRPTAAMSGSGRLTSIRRSIRPSRRSRAAYPSIRETCGPMTASICQAGFRIPGRVVKVGSQLREPTYCRRYRRATRRAQPIDSSTSHIGCRRVIRQGGMQV